MARSHRLVVTLGIAALALAGGAVPARSAGKLNPRYLDLLERYARGERPAAIAGLADWSEERARQAGRRARGRAA